MNDLPNIISYHPKTPHIIHMNIPLHLRYSPWMADQDFVELFQNVVAYTLIDIYRCYELFTIIPQTEYIDGCIVEIGVWKGGSAAILAKSLQKAKIDKNLYLADTFSGVVKAGEKDTGYIGGEHAESSVDDVRKLFQSLELKEPNILSGIFPDETGDAIQEKISLLHIDVDVYQSAKDTFEWSLQKLSPGAIVIFDDYGFQKCGGVTQFCNELHGRKDFIFIYNLNGHAILIKR